MRMQYLAIPAVCLAVATSCSRGVSVKTIPVTGTVIYNGAPLGGATVTFVNVDPDGRSATGITEADGKFKLTTLVTPGRNQNGAVEGEYVATVFKTGANTMVGATQPGLKSEDMKNMSPEEMQKFAGRERQAPPNKGRDMAEPEKPKSLVPEKYNDQKTSGLSCTVSEANHDFTLELKD